MTQLAPTADAATPENGAVIEAPLNKLKKSPRNARRTPHAEADIEALAASIAAKGVLQAPVVEPETDADGAPTGFYLVTIGEGRRLALRLLAQRRVIKKTEPVRCVVVLNTDRRTYHIELRATPATYMPSVAWRYPQDEARAAVAAAAAEQAAIPAVAVENLNFDYRIDGAKPAWRPVRVFDDGRQTFIEFPPQVTQSEMPPLFINAVHGRDGELVNYRVNGQRMIVDRLFDTAELRLGDSHGQQKVRIERTVRR